jgi:type IV secretion system pilin
MTNALSGINKNLLAIQEEEAGVGGGFVPEGSGGVLPVDPLMSKFPNVPSIISQLLPYIYVAAGLLLLLMLISGGITLMTSGGNPEKSKAGYGRIKGALIGFLIIFVSYFIALIVEKVLGVKFM